MKKFPTNLAMLRNVLFHSLLIFVTFFSFIGKGWGQTTLISPTGDGGFENGSTFAANGWNTVNATTDGWFVGNAPVVANGNNCGYISSTGGGGWDYSQFSVFNHMYRDITIPANESRVTLSFKWKVGGEGTTTFDYDNMKVFLASTSTIPTSTAAVFGATQLSGPGAVSGMYKLNSLAWNNETIVFAGVPGTTYRLIFQWKSDVSDIANPPAALDDISVVTSLPGIFTSITTGDWNNPLTWDANATPCAADDAIVEIGHTVTTNATGQAINYLTVNGTLAFGLTPTQFNVNGNLTVNAGGLINVFNSTTGKILVVSGNIVNDGRIDLSVSTTTSSTTQGNLTLNGSNVQTVSGSGTFGGSVTSTTSTNTVGVIRHLLLANTSSSFPNIVWNVNNVRLMNGIVVNSNNKINLNSNKLYFGNFGSFTSGTTTVNNPGSGFYNGSISRWWTTGQTGTVITAGTDPTNSTSRFPFINNLGHSRAFYISRSSTTSTGNTAGYITVIYNDVAGITTGLNIADTPYSITDRSNGNWTISTENGYVYASGTHTLVGFYSNGLFVTSNTSARLMNQNAVVGAFQNGSLTPAAQRTGLSTANLTANSFYIGTNTADIPYVSIANGDWETASTWNKNAVPTATDVVYIANGTTVAVNAAAAVSSAITISAGGTLNVAGSTLNVGPTGGGNKVFSNSGILNVSNGTLNVNGNITNAIGSTFTQSGGNINIDGNAAGNATNSVASGTALLQFNQLNSGINLTGGTLTIVDPHASSTSSNSIGYSNSTTGTQTSTAGHTLRFGDGISTDAGGNVNGFRVDPWTSSAFLSFGNIIVNGSTGTNRSVTSAYQLAALGDVTVTAGSTLNLSSALVAASNVSINSGGTFINLGGVAAALIASNTGSSLTFGPSTSAQIIGGSGTYQNLATAPTANLASLTVNNTNATGVTLSIPLSISGSLTMAAGAITTVQSGASLTVNGVLTNDGTLTLESGATLVQGASSTLAGTGGTYNVKQAVTGATDGTNPNGRFWYIGSPVALSSSSVLFFGANDVVKKRDEPNNTWTALTSGSENLAVGRGYYMRTTQSTPTINFTGGAINNHPTTAAGLTLNLSRTTGQGFEGFNLVSNPYPSYLDWDLVTKDQVENTMWYRTADNTNTMVFETYVSGAANGFGTSNSGNTATKLIPPMQSFWVRVASTYTSGSITLNNSMRSHFASYGSSTAGLRSTVNDFNLFLRMNLLQEDKKDQIIVYVNENSSNQYDAFDGEKMMQVDRPQFYTTASGKKIVINGLSAEDTQQSLPITMELTTTGTHQFMVEDLEIAAGNVWLEDKLKETYQLLEPGFGYKFFAYAGLTDDRFVLHLKLKDANSPSTPNFDAANEMAANHANVYSEGAGVVVIKLPSTDDVATDVQIYDASGRIFFTGTIKSLESKIQLEQAKGIYYVSLTSVNGVEVRKVFIH